MQAACELQLSILVLKHSPPPYAVMFLRSLFEAGRGICLQACTFLPQVEMHEHADARLDWLA